MDIKFLPANGDAGISKIYVNVDLKASSMDEDFWINSKK